MRKDRQFSSRETNATRRARWIRNVVQAVCVIGLALLVTSCMAQRADLVKMEEDFKGEISKLDREKRILAQTLEEAKENIAASKAMLQEQKSELDELRKASARLNLDLQRQHEESQANVVSELETHAHELETQSRRLEQIDRTLADLTRNDAALKKGLEQGATRTDGLRTDVEQTLDQRNKQVNEQFAAFQKSLVEFKKTLTRVDKRLVQALKEEQDRATTSETTMQQDFTKQQDAFQVKLDADTQTLKQYVEASVNTTMTTVNEALKKIATRLNADVKAQAEVVERETGRISEELARMETALQKAERTVAANLTQTQTQVKTQAKNVETQAKNVQELRQAVVQMRGVLDSMGKLLGERGDDQMKQVGQTMARLDRMEQAQSSEMAKQAEKTQAIATHLNEVTASVESVVQSFEEFKTAMTARLNEQAESVASSAKASDVQRLQRELKANVKHWNKLSRSIAKLKDVSNALVTKLGSKIDEHESRIVELQKTLKQSRRSAPKSKSP